MIPSLVHLREHAFVSGNLEGSLDVENAPDDVLAVILGNTHEPLDIQRVGEMLAAMPSHKEQGDEYLTRATSLMEAAGALGLKDEAEGGQLGTVVRINVGAAFESFLLLLRGQCFPKLEELDLTSAIRGGARWRMESFVDAILQGWLASCTELNLGQNIMNDADMQLFSQAVESGKLPNLKKLFFRYNRIGDAGMTALAGAIRTGGSNLVTLDLYGNSIGDDGIKAFSTEIAHGMRLLDVLDLGANNFGDAGMIAFADAVRSGALPLCTSIGLGSNNISDRGMEAFRNAIERGSLPKLLSLSLQGNPGNDGPAYTAFFRRPPLPSQTPPRA